MSADNSSTATPPHDASAVQFRNATASDAPAIWNLVRDSDVLELNSIYCYLLICRDFASTCVIACRDAQAIGFVIAYRPPERARTVFVWQIGVSASVRRQGLAKRLLEQLLLLPGCQGVEYLEATVTPSNEISRKLFTSFASDLDIPCHVQQGFTADMFGCGDHEEEELFRIGPFR